MEGSEGVWCGDGRIGGICCGIGYGVIVEYG